MQPDCTGHDSQPEPEESECDLWCDPAECKVLNEEMCRCEMALFCDGNGICETGEYPDSSDCPQCDDGDPCTQDGYDYGLASCVYESIVPCCGNMDCEEGEDDVACPEDCLEEQEGDVRIVALDESEEWVDIEGYNVVMDGWTLSDSGEKHVYTFPDWFMIEGTVRLHRGYGNDSQTDLFWQSNSYVWNNDGDTATIRDNYGVVVDMFTYP